MTLIIVAAYIVAVAMFMDSHSSTVSSTAPTQASGYSGFSVKPSSIRLVNIRPGDVVNRKVTIKPGNDKKINITNWSSNINTLHLTVTNHADGTWRADVTYVAPQTSFEEQVFGGIIFYTEEPVDEDLDIQYPDGMSPPPPLFNVSVSGSVTPDAIASPNDLIVLNDGNSANTLSLHVKSLRKTSIIKAAFHESGIERNISHASKDTGKKGKWQSNHHIQINSSDIEHIQEFKIHLKDIDAESSTKTYSVTVGVQRI